MWNDDSTMIQNSNHNAGVTTTSKRRQNADIRAASRKRTKRTRIEIEFSKLSDEEQRYYVEIFRGMISRDNLEGGRAAVTTDSSRDSEQQIQREESNAVDVADEQQLGRLRLILGRVLSEEAELRAQERKLRLEIKRLQRRISQMREPLLFTKREHSPSIMLVDLMFKAPPTSCIIDLTTNDDATANDALENTRSLWILSHQRGSRFLEKTGQLRIQEDRDAILPQHSRQIDMQPQIPQQSCHRQISHHKRELLKEKSSQREREIMLQENITLQEMGREKISNQFAENIVEQKSHRSAMNSFEPLSVLPQPVGKGLIGSCLNQFESNLGAQHYQVNSYFHDDLELQWTDKNHHEFKLATESKHQHGDPSSFEEENTDLNETVVHSRQSDSSSSIYSDSLGNCTDKITAASISDFDFYLCDCGDEEGHDHDNKLRNCLDHVVIDDDEPLVPPAVNSVRYLPRS